MLGPSVEVSASVDGTTRALVRTDGPVLVEGAGALDGGGVVTGALEDLVVGAVDVDGALAGGAGGGVVGAEVLDDVVLNERVAGPAVDGEVGVAVGLVGTAVVDGAGEER